MINNDEDNSPHLNNDNILEIKWIIWCQWQLFLDLTESPLLWYANVKTYIKEQRGYGESYFLSLGT